MREVPHQDLQPSNALNFSLCCLHSSVISYNFFNTPVFFCCSSVALQHLLDRTARIRLNLTLLLLLLAAPVQLISNHSDWSCFKFMTQPQVGTVCPPPVLYFLRLLFFNGIIFNYYCNFYCYH